MKKYKVVNKRKFEENVVLPLMVVVFVFIICAVIMIDGAEAATTAAGKNLLEAVCF